MSKHKLLLQKGINCESTMIEPENSRKGNPSVQPLCQEGYTCLVLQLNQYKQHIYI